MEGSCLEGIGQAGYDDLADRLGIEKDTEEFITVMRREKETVGGNLLLV